MLQNIRDKSTGMLAWIIVILLIATFALWGIHNYMTSAKMNDLAASVDHQSITQAQVNAAYQRLRQQSQLQLGADFSLTPSAEAAMKRQALNQLVVTRVLINAAQKSGYRVTTDQVNEALLQIPAFQVNGQFSAGRFHDILNGLLYTQTQFLEDMRSSMLINQVQGGYVNSAFVLPREVDQAIRLINQKRDFDYVVIPATRFSNGIKISPEEINQYYQSHQSQFQSPEQVSIEYVKLSLDNIKNKLHFDRTKLMQYYENNLQTFTEPVQWHVTTILIKSDKAKADDVYQQLKTGKNFAELAKKYSEDTLTASKGGELAWFKAGTLDPVFEKTAAQLQQVGDFSTPVKTGYGYSIIKLLGQKKAEVKPFEAVRSQVESALTQQQAEQIFSDEADKLSSLTYANPTSLDIAAKTLNLNIESTGLFDKKGTKEGVTSNRKVLQAAFSNDVLQQGNNSDLLQLDPNTLVILRVKTHKPAAVLPLADVANTIQAQLTHQKAQDDAQQFGQKLMTESHDKNLSLPKLASIYRLSLQQERSASRFDPKIDTAILTKAFETNTLTGMVLSSGDYAVVMTTAIHEGVINKDDAAQQRIFQEQIESSYGHAEYQLYVQDLMKRAKIKINPAESTPTDNNPADITS